MSCYRTIKNGKPYNVWIFKEEKINWNQILDSESIMSQEIDKCFIKETIRLFRG